MFKNFRMYGIDWLSVMMFEWSEKKIKGYIKRYELLHINQLYNIKNKFESIMNYDETTSNYVKSEYVNINNSYLVSTLFFTLAFNYFDKDNNLEGLQLSVALIGLLPLSIAGCSFYNYMKKIRLKNKVNALEIVINRKMEEISIQ